MLEEIPNFKHKAIKKDTPRQFALQGQLANQNRNEQRVKQSKQIYQAETQTTPPVVPAQRQRSTSPISHAFWQRHPQRQTQSQAWAESGAYPAIVRLSTPDPRIRPLVEAPMLPTTGGNNLVGYHNAPANFSTGGNNQMVYQNGPINLPVPLQSVPPAPPVPPDPPDPPASPNLSRVRGSSFKHRRRVPVFTQMAATECGAACLAMLLTYYGYQTSVSEVSTVCGVGRDGLTAKNVLKAARRYGLKASAAAFDDTDNMTQLPLPVIVHWQFNHFIIVERWSSKRVYVVDPAVGRRTLAREEFDQGFTGVALLFQPGPEFTQRRVAPRIALLRAYVQDTIRMAPSSIAQVLISSFVLLLLGLVMPVTTVLVVNDIVPQSLNNLLLVFGLGMGCILIAQTVLNYMRSIVLTKLQARIDTNLMVGFFDHLLSLPIRYFQMRSSGDILNRLNSNTAIRDTVNSQFISSILDTVSVIVYLAILIWLSPIFALVSLLFEVAQVIIMLCSNWAILALLKHSLEAEGKSQGYLTEMLMNLATVKAAGAESHVRSHWLRLFFAEMSVAVRRDYLFSFVDALQSIIRSLAPMVLLLIGAQQVIAGSLSLGTMLALLSLATSLLMPLESLVNTGQQIQLTYAHLERITDVMKAEPEQHNQQLSPPPRLTGHIQLLNVGFQYDTNSPPILHDINLTIYPGQKVALVGRSGSGKSTLGKLLLGLYTPTQGEILYDTIPLRFMNYQAVRAQFGVVTQDIGLFNGSVRENIVFNIPGIDLQEVMNAAHLAAIHEDVMRMPMEYETIVSEGGNALSGGQRQRLALARALVRKPSILLLDEATSSLDVATERIVEQNLRSLPCTQILIAHRLSTIRNADLILALDEGTIVECGTHEELLLRNGFYAHLIADQIASGDIQQTSMSIQVPAISTPVKQSLQFLQQPGHRNR